MDALGVPIVLLATIWGAFAVVFKALELMTDRRDLFHGFKLHGSTDTTCDIDIKLHHFLDWLPLWFGVMIFLIIFSVIIFFVPDFLDIDDETYQSKIEFIRNICSIAAAIPLFGAIAFLFGGLYDIAIFYKAHKHRRRSKS